MQSVYGAMADLYRRTSVGCIQEDWCGTYTERSGVGPRRENGVGLMRKTAVRD